MVVHLFVCLFETSSCLWSARISGMYCYLSQNLSLLFSVIFLSASRIWGFSLSGIMAIGLFVQTLLCVPHFFLLVQTLRKSDFTSTIPQVTWPLYCSQNLLKEEIANKASGGFIKCFAFPRMRVPSVGGRGAEL